MLRLEMEASVEVVEIIQMRNDGGPIQDNGMESKIEGSDISNLSLSLSLSHLSHR
jgi:hypothetical protein